MRVIARPWSLACLSSVMLVGVVVITAFQMPSARAQGLVDPVDSIQRPIEPPSFESADEEALLQALMDPDASTREAAMRWLMREDGDDVEPLLAMARRLTTLAPEEVSGFEAEGLSRLRQVARHRLIRSIMRDYLDGNEVASEDGAMGVATWPVRKLLVGGVGRQDALGRNIPQRNAHGENRIELEVRRQDGVLILGPGISRENLEAGLQVYRTVPGMPAHGVLRVGDRLLGIQDQWIPQNASTSWLSNVVTRSDRGDTLILKVERQGVMVEVPMVLTGSRALQEISDQSTGSIREPYLSEILALEARFDRLLAGPRRLPAAPQIVQP